MRYFIITYGCQMNRSDSERVASVLEKIGYKNTSKMDEANLIVVNMCSVRQSAVDRIYGLQPKFKKLRTSNFELRTILTGCILKKDRKKFAEYFDHILDIKNLRNWPKNLKKITPLKRPAIVSDLREIPNNYFKIPSKYSSFPAGYVPISTGCNNFCSYCVVPHIRGPEIFHRPSEEILSEVKDLVKKDYKEIWLLGQNVNRYRSKSKIKNQKSKIIDFPRLLKMVNDIPGNFWIRFTSSHPKNFSDELIETMADCEKVTPYLNLPVQSGDNQILRKMNRNYAAKDYINLVKKIRAKIPDIALSTDVIVGFPGETKKQFQNTVKLFKKIKFDMAYIAQYSPRWSTTAFKMKDNVPSQIKKEREIILTEILKKTAQEKNKKYLGKTVKVLPINKKGKFLIGKSLHHKTVKFQVSGLKFQDLIGKFVDIKITNAQSWGLKGGLVK